MASSWDGWYVVEGDVTISDHISVIPSKTANIILVNGSVLTAEKGFSVYAGGTLNIYSQSGDDGSLNAQGTDLAAGIGNGADNPVGEINIHGGTVTAAGGIVDVNYGFGIGRGEVTEPTAA